MSDIELYETASGPCIVCRKDSTGSLYWTQMPRDIWLKVRPSFAVLFNNNLDMLQDIFFVPKYCKPFCSPQCSLIHKFWQYTNCSFRKREQWCGNITCKCVIFEQKIEETRDGETSRKEDREATE